jgi:hypothetical protein
MGVMIGMLGGNKDTVDAIKGSLGKKLTGIALTEDRLVMTFVDKSILTIQDSGQSCCESRYMRTDDNLAKYVGGKLMDVTLESAPDSPDEYGQHEVQFLHVKTGKGSFTMSSHNEHNGYYGGFWITASVEQEEV